MHEIITGYHITARYTKYTVTCFKAANQGMHQQRSLHSLCGEVITEQKNMERSLGKKMKEEPANCKQVEGNSSSIPPLNIIIFLQKNFHYLIDTKEESEHLLIGRDENI